MTEQPRSRVRHYFAAFQAMTVLGGMWTLLLRVWILIVLAPFVLAQRHQIVDGQEIADEEFGWFVVIRNFTDGKFLCSGSLIGSRYVLTANHCVLNFFSVIVEVGYLCQGRDNCGRDNEIIGVRDVFRHESGGDLAVLNLDRPTSLNIVPVVPYLGPNYYPNQRSLTKGRKMTLVGAGKDGTRGEINSRVNKLKVKYMDPDECRTVIVKPSLVTDTIVCSIAKRGNPCSGDSGSALVVKGRNQFKGREVVLAVHSFGYTDCSGPRDRPLGHVRVQDGAALILRVVCERESPEDWCRVQSIEQDFTVPPSASPVVAPSAFPTLPQPTLSPVYPPTESPTTSPSLTPTLQPVQPTSSILQDLEASEPSIKHVSLLHMLGDVPGSVESVSFNMDGTRLVSVEWGMGILFWDPFHGGPPWLRIDRTNAETVQFHPNNNTIIAVGAGKQVVLYYIENLPQNSNTVQREILTRHKDTVHALSWNVNGTTLASLSKSEKTIVLWNTLDPSSPGKRLSAGSLYFAESVALPPDGTQIVFNSAHDIEIRSVDSFAPIRKLKRAHQETIRSIRYSPDGTLLASASQDRTVRVWSMATGEAIRVLKGHKRAVTAVAWSPKGRYLASVSVDETLRVWDVRKGTSIAKLDTGSSFVKTVDWKGNYIASGRGNVLVWLVHRES